MPNIIVQVSERAWQADSEDPQSMTRRVVGTLFEHLGLSSSTADLTVRFADDGEVRALNLQFRGKDAATNVLSFRANQVPAREDDGLGDVILAYETVVREAGEQGKTIENHTAHLVVHGVLHLLGYDHDTDEKAEAMELIEKDVLAQLGICDPYADETRSEAAHGA